MSNSIKFAVIGAGRIGVVHASSVSKIPGATLEYVVDPIKESADKLASQFGCKAAYDAEAIIKSGEVDAVIIGSPTPTHVPLLSTAIDHGIHALIPRKPTYQSVSIVALTLSTTLQKRRYLRE
jgi:myo-inositol 2-dehydrogenase/D-chiro-inositol 1-dehydrogenase